MIPAPYHFENIAREACVHPDVAAEIEAARRRESAQSAKLPSVFAAVLKHVPPKRLVRHDLARRAVGIARHWL